jgi:hypothetical protein
VEFSATTLDFEAMGSFRVSPDFVLALNAGYRLDGSAKAAENASRLSPSDRISLGVSSFDAILLGLGAELRLDAVQFFGEWTWDVLVGGGAPSATESPMRVGAGGRLWVLEQLDLQLEARLDVLVSGRPDLTAATLAPVEPRVSFTVGATFRFPAPDVPVVDGVDTTDDPVAEAVGVVEGRLEDEQGQPVEGAAVLVRRGEAPNVQSFGPVTTGADGEYRIPEVPVGDYDLVVSADGFREATVPITVGGGQTVEPQVAMERDLPSGQIRGVVQSFRGEPVVATIRVEPLGSEVTADEEGIFQIDVPPGAYTVTVSATGYAEQSRPIVVEERGVTILNIDLRAR